MLRIFEFGVLLFDCLSSKCNLSETFYQVWALHRWGGRHNRRQTRSYLKSLCQKLARLVAVWWRYAKSSWLWFLWSHHGDSAIAEAEFVFSGCFCYYWMWLGSVGMKANAFSFIPSVKSLSWPVFVSIDVSCFWCSHLWCLDFRIVNPGTIINACYTRYHLMFQGSEVIAYKFIIFQ